MRPIDDFEDDLEAIFIEETFHKSEPIREKPIKTSIEKVFIKDKRKKGLNGIKCEFKPIRQTITERFAELQTRRRDAGVVFITDDSEDEDEEEDNDEFEDIDVETTEELGLRTSKSMVRANKRKLTINLAQKLKKRSIANRLGMTYLPGNTRSKLNDLKTRLGTKTKSWSEKFGRLLAAKKLLYLPLLYRRYRSGPMKTKQELDIEIDLYMSEIKTKKLAFDDITNASNNTDANNNNGITVVNIKELFGGFGGPGWRKRITKVEKPVVDKETLDVDLDEYMKNNGKMNDNVVKGEDKDVLDMEIDEYMAQKSKISV